MARLCRAAGQTNPVGDVTRRGPDHVRGGAGFVAPGRSVERRSRRPRSIPRYWPAHGGGSFLADGGLHEGDRGSCHVHTVCTSRGGAPSGAVPAGRLGQRRRYLGVTPEPGCSTATRGSRFVLGCSKRSACPPHLKVISDQLAASLDAAYGKVADGLGSNPAVEITTGKLSLARLGALLNRPP